MFAIKNIQRNEYMQHHREDGWIATTDISKARLYSREKTAREYRDLIVSAMNSCRTTDAWAEYSVGYAWKNSNDSDIVVITLDKDK